MKPTPARAFAKGTVFGSSVALLATGIALVSTGGTGLFLPAAGIAVGGAANLVGEFVLASLGGAAIFGPLFAATDYIVHSIPGLDKLVGADRMPPERNAGMGRSHSHGKHLPSPERLHYKELRRDEKNIFALDHVRSNHVEQLEAERASGHSGGISH